MSVLQPRGIFIIEVGQRALLQRDVDACRLILVGIQPVVAQFDQFYGGLGNGLFAL